MEKGCVYIVLLNYRSYKDTLECLESLYKLTYPNFKIIIVDNSEDATQIQHIERWVSEEDGKKFMSCVSIQENQLKNIIDFEKLLIIQAEKNNGFAAGNNIALRHILSSSESGNYIWILNNDVVVEPNSLEELVKFFEKSTLEKKLGILGSKLLYYHKPEKIQAIGGAFNEYLYLPSHLAEGMDRNIKKEDFPTIDYVLGASMFISYDFLENVGLLNEDYFLYYEELDWSKRADQKGWKIDWCNETVVYHKEGASIGSSYDSKMKTDFSEIQLFESRKKFIRRYYKLDFRFYFSTVLLILNRFRKGRFILAGKLLKMTFSDERKK